MRELMQLHRPKPLEGRELKQPGGRLSVLKCANSACDCRHAKLIEDRSGVSELYWVECGRCGYRYEYTPPAFELNELRSRAGNILAIQKRGGQVPSADVAAADAVIRMKFSPIDAQKVMGFKIKEEAPRAKPTPEQLTEHFVNAVSGR